MIEYYSNPGSEYPIYSIEDGLDESDFDGWDVIDSKTREKVVLVEMTFL